MKKFVTLHGHMNLKFPDLFLNNFWFCKHNWAYGTIPCLPEKNTCFSNCPFRPLPISDWKWRYKTKKESCFGMEITGRSVVAVLHRHNASTWSQVSAGQVMRRGQRTESFCMVDHETGVKKKQNIRWCINLSAVKFHFDSHTSSS